MFKFVRFAVVAVVIMLGAVLIAACGGDDDEDPAPAAPTNVSAQPTPSGSGGSPAQGTVTVTAVDFGYSPTTLTARAGQQINLNFVNNGAAPHTFTITGVVDSGSVAGGQSKPVTFTPTAAGTLQFICTIHGAASMSGQVTVQ